LGTQGVLMKEVASGAEQVLLRRRVQSLMQVVNHHSCRWASLLEYAAPAIAGVATTITTAAVASVLAWFRFIHIQCATIYFAAIELLNCGSAFFFAGHFDEAKTA